MEGIVIQWIWHLVTQEEAPNSIPCSEPYSFPCYSGEECGLYKSALRLLFLLEVDLNTLIISQKHKSACTIQEILVTP